MRSSGGPTSELLTTPLPSTSARPPRPRLGRLAVVARLAEPFEVRRVQVRAAVLPLDLVVEDQALRGGADGAPLVRLPLASLSPLGRLVEPVSLLRHRRHARGEPSDTRWHGLEPAHRDDLNRTRAARPHAQAAPARWERSYAEYNTTSVPKVYPRNASKRTPFIFMSKI